MKSFCFTVDDNVRFLKELNEGTCESIFDHPYLGMYKRLHEKFGLKIQLNLFYETQGFCLADMSERFCDQWRANADWLKMSFHSRAETDLPYVEADYNEVYCDCEAVQQQILRFAGSEVLAKTTTVHYCRTTPMGLSALKDNGVQGLLGLYGTEQKPRTSYQNTLDEAALLRSGKTVLQDGMLYAGIDVVLNCYSIEQNLSQLKELSKRDFVKVMIHEQYFYPDYPRYQSDFEEKLDAVFSFLTQNGFSSIFLEEKL